MPLAKPQKMGRPKEFNEEQALQLAMDYFWDHGYDSASLSHLLSVMKISKSSFYQTFVSKQNLFERCLALYGEQQITWFNAQLKEQSAQQLLLSILKISADEIQQTGQIRGCLLMNNAQVCYKKYPDLSHLIAQQFKQFHQAFTEIIQHGQDTGDITTHFEPSMLASIFINTLNGLSIMIKAGADATIIHHILQGFELQIKK